MRHGNFDGVLESGDSAGNIIGRRAGGGPVGFDRRELGALKKRKEEEKEER